MAAQERGGPVVAHQLGASGEQRVVDGLVGGEAEPPVAPHPPQQRPQRVDLGEVLRVVGTGDHLDRRTPTQHPPQHQQRRVPDRDLAVDPPQAAGQDPVPPGQPGERLVRQDRGPPAVGVDRRALGRRVEREPRVDREHRVHVLPHRHLERRVGARAQAHDAHPGAVRGQLGDDVTHVVDPVRREGSVVLAAR